MLSQKDTSTYSKLLSSLDFLHQNLLNQNNKKKNYGPFLWMGFNCLKARATSRRQFTFYHKVPRNSWYSFYRPWKNERLSRPWSHPVVLNMGPLGWESSALSTKNLQNHQKKFLRSQ